MRAEKIHQMTCFYFSMALLFSAMTFDSVHSAPKLQTRNRIGGDEIPKNHPLHSMAKAYDALSLSVLRTLETRPIPQAYTTAQLMTIRGQQYLSLSTFDGFSKNSKGEDAVRAMHMFSVDPNQGFRLVYADLHPEHVAGFKTIKIDTATIHFHESETYITFKSGKKSIPVVYIPKSGNGRRVHSTLVFASKRESLSVTHDQMRIAHVIVYEYRGSGANRTLYKFETSLVINTETGIFNPLGDVNSWTSKPATQQELEFFAI